MTDKTILNSYQEILNQIHNNRIFSAIDLIDSFILDNEINIGHDELNDIKNTYKNIVHYFIEGYNDEMREKLYNEIVLKLSQFVDNIFIEANLKTNNSLYYSTLRSLKRRNVQLIPLLNSYINEENLISLMRETASFDKNILMKHEGQLSEIFESVWTLYHLTSSQKRDLNEILLSESSPNDLKVIIITALMFSLFSFYDRNKLILLLDFYDFYSERDEYLAAKSLGALFILFIKWENKISNDVEIRLKLSEWQDSILKYSQIKEIITSLLKAFDTKRVTEKMKKELIPGLMKIKPDVLNKLRDISFEKDERDMEFNPEWENIIKESGVEDTIKEISELQADGSDVMMMAFSSLKNFPFFKNISNWFLPFNQYHSSVINININSDLFELLDASGFLCDSDKYSFVMSIENMPSSQKNMALNSMNQQLSSLKEEINEKLSLKSNTNFSKSANDFFRNLYRFFRLFNRKNEFDDIFSNPINFTDIHIIDGIVSNEEILSKIAEFYFKYGYYHLAIGLFEKIADINNSYEYLYEKIGFSHQMLNDFNSALENYNKALLFNPDSEWILRKIAYTHRCLGNYKEALELYSQLSEKNIDNVPLIMNIGNMEYQLGNIDSALMNYYNVVFLKEDHFNANKMVAWCEFLKGNYDKSQEYFDKIFSHTDKLKTEDYVNRSYLSLISSDYKNAVNYLRLAEKMPVEKTEIVEAFLKNKNILNGKGVKDLTINLIIDKFLEIN